MRGLEDGRRPRIVIVGGGFGGLACARVLGSRADIDVIVVDRRNHNLFQPLLYQVATAALSPADISEPIRRTLGRYRNIKVMLGEAQGVDCVGKNLLLRDGSTVAYDVLVLATGSVYNYFGHPEWQEYAPGLKSVHEARLIRQRLLLAFERAERIPHPEARRELLTSVVIGGGPTGVEMAGAISELARFMVKRDFRNIEPAEIRIVLVEAGDRLLAAFPEGLARYAQTYLEAIGVEIRVGQRVTDIRRGSVTVGDEVMRCGCIIWGAGIKPSPAASWLGIIDRGGKIPVDENLQVAGIEDIFAVGDTAFARGRSGEPLPALAQVAKQQGTHLGRQLLRLVEGHQMTPFQFHNRGNTAVVGRHAAIFDFGSWTMRGRLAWLLWAIVHVALLVNFEKRLLVSVQWTWRYVTRQRGARLIDETAFEADDRLTPGARD